MAFVPAASLDRPSSNNGQRENLTNGTCDRTEYKLYVDNLPAELNEDGITQMFKQYGEVSSILSPPNVSWAFVTYKTYREAVLAIGGLHNQSPLNLKVEFSKGRQSKNVRDHKEKASIPPSNSGMAPEFRGNSFAPDYRENNGDYVPRNHLPSRPMGVNIPDIYRSRCMVPAYDIQDDIMYPVEADPRIMNPFENVYPYPETNLLWTRNVVEYLDEDVVDYLSWTRGTLAFNRNGRRQVHLGRGYTRYDIPDSYPRIEENISALYERRSNVSIDLHPQSLPFEFHGLYEYGDDVLRSEIGRCELCNHITKMRCSKCTTFYCSRSCQQRDWEKHKIECLSLPPLTGVPNPVQELTERVSLLNQRAKVRSVPRMPQAPEQEYVQEVSISAPQQDLEPRLNNQPESHLKLPPEEEKVPEGSPVKAMSTSAGKDYEKMEEEIAFQKKTFLSKDSFTNVVVTIGLKDCEYWVQKSEDGSSFTTLMNGLEQSHVAPPAKHVVGDLIACKYYNVWHRALITSVDPLTVHYIDYGNDEVLKDLDIRELGSFEKIAPFAGKIKIYNGKGTKFESLQENDQLLVKMISENKDGLIAVITPELETEALKAHPKSGGPGSHSGHGSESGRLSQNDASQNRRASQGSNTSKSGYPQTGHASPSVHVSQHNYKSTSRTEASPQQRNSMDSRLPSSAKSPASSTHGSVKGAPAAEIPCPCGNIVSHLQVQDEGFIELHSQLGSDKFSGTIIPHKFKHFYKLILSDVPLNAAQLSKSQNYVPSKVGEIVIGMRADGDWVRGEVLSLGSPLKVAVIDEGRVSTITHCLMMPSKLSEICSFGVTCSLIDYDEKASPLLTFPFKVLSVKTVENHKIVEIQMADANKKACKAYLTKWIPPPEQVGVPMLELKTNTEVVLTAFRSQSLLYARSVEKNEIERFSGLLQEVAKKAQTAPKLKTPPVVGEMVLAKFKEDNNFYRAIVTKIEGEQIYITYIDFGNVEISSLKSMLEMPSELKECQSLSAKIVLKGVPKDVPMSEDLSKYFAVLVGSEQPLKITFDGIPSEDGVELTTASRESVNEKVRKLLTPDWKKAEEAKICFMFDEMPTGAPLGPKGHTVSALVLHVEENVLECFLCSTDDVDLITHINSYLPVELEKYVKSGGEHYIPRDCELCIAPYNGAWYRGVCVERNATATESSVFFYDYGNVDRVKHTDLRLMTKDFVSPPALAVYCKIKNLVPAEMEKNMSDKLKQRIRSLLTPDNPARVKILNIDDDNAHLIEVPDIRDILLKEKLI